MNEQRGDNVAGLFARVVIFLAFIYGAAYMALGGLAARGCP